MPAVEIIEKVAFFVAQATGEDSAGKPIELSINRRFHDFDELDRRVCNKTHEKLDTLLYTQTIS